MSSYRSSGSAEADVAVGLCYLAFCCCRAICEEDDTASSRRGASAHSSGYKSRLLQNDSDRVVLGSVRASSAENSTGFKSSLLQQGHPLSSLPPASGARPLPVASAPALGVSTELCTTCRGPLVPYAPFCAYCGTLARPAATAAATAAAAAASTLPTTTVMSRDEPGTVNTGPSAPPGYY